MKLIKITLSLALISNLLFAEEATSDIGVSANLALTSNYIWRGMTQTKDSPAIQGGVDATYKNLYIGAWGSNVDFGDDDNSLEADIYGGYKDELGGIGFDIGAIQYIYPNMSDEYNFAEVYFGLSKDFEKFGVSAKYSIGVETDTINPENYLQGAAWVEIPYEVKLGLGYGNYEDIGDNYSISLTKSFEKFDVSVAYIEFNHDNDAELDEENVVVTLSSTF
ncbi:MAG: hypothetical protein QG559_504 [Campylobacterota bacterium]|nr:hypothetical protein [Campylobacterota bacterium]